MSYKEKTYAIDRRILEGSLDEFYPAHVFENDNPDVVMTRIKSRWVILTAARRFGLPNAPGKSA